MMSNIGSLPTGQMSTQAPQAVQAQTADSLMAKSISVNSDSLAAGQLGQVFVEDSSAC